MDEIVWEDPPKPRTGRAGDLARVVAQLQEHPGKWAIVRTCRTQGQAAGQLNRWRVLGCEAVTRRVGDECRVYARWPEDVS